MAAFFLLPLCCVALWSSHTGASVGTGLRGGFAATVEADHEVI